MKSQLGEQVTFSELTTPRYTTIIETDFVSRCKQWDMTFAVMVIESEFVSWCKKSYEWSLRLPRVSLCLFLGEISSHELSSDQFEDKQSTTTIPLSRQKTANLVN